MQWQAQPSVEDIHIAARIGHTVIVARMLEEDPELLSLKWGGETLLTRAGGNHHTGVVRLLLERGTDVNTQNDSGETALHRAACYGHEDVVSILLGSGADVFKRGRGGLTPLMCGSFSSRVAVVPLLLRAMEGRGLDERDVDGCTALWFACKRRNVDSLRALLLAGADYTIADNDGTTPQQAAAQWGDRRCVELLEVSTVLTDHNTPHAKFVTVWMY
jgi:ankyrin repeat protein